MYPYSEYIPVAMIVGGIILIGNGANMSTAGAGGCTIAGAILIGSAYLGMVRQGLIGNVESWSVAGDGPESSKSDEKDGAQ